MAVFQIINREKKRKCTANRGKLAAAKGEKEKQKRASKRSKLIYARASYKNKCTIVKFMQKYVN